MLVSCALHWVHMHRIGVLHNGWSFFLFLLSVKENVITSEDGESIIEWDLVKAAPLIKSPGYDLLNDDPVVYSDGEDFDGFCPDREWPNEELASQLPPVPTLQATQSLSPAFSASDSQVKKLLESHHPQVEVLKSIGIDSSLEYQQGQATYHLAKVRKGDVVCPFCSRSCTNAQKLKNHIRFKHQDVTNAPCVTSPLVTLIP